jgi:hypothetical protein
MTQAPADQLIEKVLHSLINEHAVDEAVAKRYFSTSEINRVPGFKHIKTLPLRARLGFLFWPCIIAAGTCIPFHNIALLLRALLGAPFRRTTENANDAIFFLKFFETNIALVENALQGDAHRLRAIDRTDLAAGLGLGAQLRVFSLLAKLYIAMLRNNDGLPFFDLVLHSYKAIDLILLASFLERHPSAQFVTTSMFQKWTYVLGARAHGSGPWIVQHGVLPTDINVLYSFPPVERIYAFSDEQGAIFEALFYSANSILITPASLDITPIEADQRGVFLGSSFPHIDAELEVLSWVKANSDVPIWIKLHPKHIYDQRAKQLLALGDHVVTGDTSPQCLVFLSHSSTYGLHYEQAGVPSFSFGLYDNSAQFYNDLSTVLKKHEAKHGKTARD